ncbi:MAG: glycosyltransferase [Alphaproteobacteria bacterium]|nr:glycosyltransferase [Alphaproteobacteria bacterium]
MTRQATRAALLDQVWPDGTEFIVLPPGPPRAKPRALNYGLARARGAYIVVYDAEDCPDPRQLRDAVAAFARGPSSLAPFRRPSWGRRKGAAGCRRSGRWNMPSSSDVSCQRSPVSACRSRWAAPAIISIVRG